MTAPDPSRLAWRKSSRSSANSNCVEIAFAGQVIAARDSKNPTGPILTLDTWAWSALVCSIRDSHPTRRLPTVPH